MKRLLTLTILITLILINTGCGNKSGFTSHSAKGEGSFDYMLFTPDQGKDMPLVLTFHGYGDNKDVSASKIVSALTAPENQKIRPCYVLSPAVMDNTYLAASERDKLYSELKEIIDKMIASGKVDSERIYVMGNSFGGLATVEFTEKYPELVACAMPICPALTYSRDSTRNLKQIKDVPISFAHATNDNVIPVTVSRDACRTLTAMGAKDISLTEFTDDEMFAAGALYGFHQADFAVMADDTFMKWMFEQKNAR